MGTNQLALAFWFCPSLQGPESERYTIVKKAFDLILSIGGVFVEIPPPPAPLAYVPVTDPYSLIDPEEKLLLYDWRHEWLLESSCGLGLDSRNGRLSVYVDASDVDRERVVQKAEGLIRLGRLLYPKLQPKLGWIDFTEIGEPSEKQIQATKLTRIMWANFFGSAYVQRYGQEFLLNAPGWLKEELPEGGILYTLSPSVLHRWSVVGRREVETYFRQKILGVEACDVQKRQFRFKVLKLKGNKAVIPVDFSFWESLSEEEKGEAKAGLLSVVTSCLPRFVEVKVEFKQMIPWEVERVLTHACQGELGSRLIWGVIQENGSL